jgi:site-specific recombinase XerD
MGLAVAPQPTTGLQDWENGIPLWISSLKARRQSPRTISGYEQDVKRYLKRDPHPTPLSIEGYIAQRFDQVSCARVASERKALRSFFKFLSSSGLTPVDPTASIQSFRVTYQ